MNTTHNVQITKQAYKQLKKLPAFVQDLADAAIADIEIEGVEPRYWNTKKIAHNQYRLRLNYRYRMVYKIQHNFLIVEVFYIGHRKDAYRSSNMFTIHHQLADLKVKPANSVDIAKLEKFIQEALNNYSKQIDNITAKKLHEETKKRHGKNYQTPNYYLRIYRLRAHLTQAALANKLEVKQHHISEMENNKRSIGKALAKKLATLLHCDYRHFL